MGGNNYKSSEAFELDDLQLQLVETENPFTPEPAYPPVFTPSSAVIDLATVRKIQTLQSKIDTLRKEITDKILNEIDNRATLVNSSDVDLAL